MINMNNIEDRIRNILNKNIKLQCPVEQIGLEDDLFAVGIDSLNSIDLIVAFEEEFGFQFNDEDLIADNFRTLKDTMSYIKSRI